MKKFMKTMTAVLIGFFFMSASAGLMAQEKKTQESGALLKEEVIRVKYISIMDAHRLIAPLVSRPIGYIGPSFEKDFIIIRDYPENIEKILALLKQIDIKPVDLIFTAQLILGEEKGGAKIDDILAGDPVVRELKGLMKYQAYTLLDSTVIRTIDKKRAYVVFGKDGNMGLELRPRFIRDEQQGAIQLDMRLVQIHERPAIINKEVTIAPAEKPKGDWHVEPISKDHAGKDNAAETEKPLIDTNLIIKPGERTVVGVSRLDGGDKGLILIISAKIVS